MAISEHVGLIVVKDHDGRKQVLYPMTKLAAVEDADEKIAELNEKAQAAEDAAKEAQALVEDAQKAAQEAKTYAGTAADVAGEAKQAAEEATNTANSAVENSAPTDHASGEATHGVGTADLYGHVKLSDAVDSEDNANGGHAATPYAVKQAYDKANAAIPAVAGATEGDIPSFDANGNLASSGIAMSDFHRCTFSLSGTTLTITTVS